MDDLPSLGRRVGGGRARQIDRGPGLAVDLEVEGLRQRVVGIVDDVESADVERGRCRRRPLDPRTGARRQRGLPPGGGIAVEGLGPPRHEVAVEPARGRDGGATGRGAEQLVDAIVGQRRGDARRAGHGELASGLWVDSAHDAQLVAAHHRFGRIGAAPGEHVAQVVVGGVGAEPIGEIDRWTNRLGDHPAVEVDACEADATDLAVHRLGIGRIGGPNREANSGERTLGKADDLPAADP